MVRWDDGKAAVRILEGGKNTLLLVPEKPPGLLLTADGMFPAQVSSWASKEEP